MLDTLRVPRSFPSLSLISPVGRSITSVGALGVDGDEKAYCEGDEWTLMSRKGRLAAAITGVGGVKSMLSVTLWISVPRECFQVIAEYRNMSRC